MNVGIVSFQFEYNYGALLQCFALQQVLQKMGFEAAHFDYIPTNYFASPYEFSNSKIPFPLIRLYRWVRRFASVQRNRTQIGTNPINLTFKKMKRIPFLPSKIASWNIQYCIAGADQIWNPNFIWGREQIYFLKFASKQTRKISYAASLGVDRWPKKFEKKVLPMLLRFDAVSVREKSAVLYLKSLGVKNVSCVCDPTILHTYDFYQQKFNLSSDAKKEVFIYRIWQDVPLVVQRILPPETKEVVLRNSKNTMFVDEWLRSINCAKFVVTDSFHCAVFCILFHKPFLVIPNRSTGKGMNERFSTLLGKTGLEYRCLTCEESHDEVLQKLNAPVDWEKVDAVLEEWRTYSANWLRNALGE